MQCKWCNEDISDGAKRCNKCGTFQPPYFYFFEIVFLVIPILAVLISIWQAHASRTEAVNAKSALRETININDSLSWYKVNPINLKNYQFDPSCDYKLTLLRKGGIEDAFYPINNQRFALRFLLNAEITFTIELKKNESSFEHNIIKNSDYYKLLSDDPVIVYQRCPSKIIHKW